MEEIDRHDEPDWIVAGGWQRVDGAHPAEGGLPAYRLVYKTLRVGLFPGVHIHFPNLRLTFDHGRVNRGGMTVSGALPARKEGAWVIPETGSMVNEGDEIVYAPKANMTYEFRAWEEDLDDIFFVELLLQTEASDPLEQLTEGRERLARLKTMLELRFGPRLLGILLAEEVGEVFPDWHFNRFLQSVRLGAESQLRAAPIWQEDLVDWQNSELARDVERAAEEKNKLSLASEWYWSAIHESDPVTAFLSYFFVLEVLAMHNTTDVGPVRAALAEGLGGTEANWKRVVNPLRDRRGAIVHGGKRDVDSEQLDN